MKFEIGKFYLNAKIHTAVSIVAKATTILWGEVLIAEVAQAGCLPLVTHVTTGDVEGWTELTKEQFCSLGAMFTKEIMERAEKAEEDKNVIQLKQPKDTMPIQSDTFQRHAAGIDKDNGQIILVCGHRIPGMENVSVKETFFCNACAGRN